MSGAAKAATLMMRTPSRPMVRTARRPAVKAVANAGGPAVRLRLWASMVQNRWGVNWTTAAPPPRGVCGQMRLVLEPALLGQGLRSAEPPQRPRGGDAGGQVSSHGGAHVSLDIGTAFRGGGCSADASEVRMAAPAARREARRSAAVAAKEVQTSTGSRGLSSGSQVDGGNGDMPPTHPSHLVEDRLRAATARVASGLSFLIVGGAGGESPPCARAGNNGSHHHTSVISRP